MTKKIDPKYLTKSRMKLGLECPKKLHYYGKKEYESQKNDNPFLEGLAEGGYQVGELAKFHYQFKFLDYHFVEITALGYDQPLKETAEALKHDKVVICEGAILVHDFFIRADIIVKNGNNIKLIEVKSKSTKSDDEHDFLTKRKPYGILAKHRPYLADIAFQQYVMTEAFPNFHIVPYLMLVNKMTASNIDGLNQLFKVVSKEINGNSRLVVESDINRINRLQNEIKDTVLEEVNVSRTVHSILTGSDLGLEKFSDELNHPLEKFNTQNYSNFIESAHHLAELYKTDTPFGSHGEYVGGQCAKCEFKSKDRSKSGYYACWSERFPDFDEAKPHMQDVWHFRAAYSKNLLDQGLWSMEHLHLHPELNPIEHSDDPSTRSFRQYMQIEKSVSQDNSEWISDDLKDIMSSWQFPYHFIDFETCTVPLPFHKGEHSYSTIGFQFSLHTLHENGTMTHHEWLSEISSIDPSLQFVKAIKDLLQNDNGSIFQYYIHENTTLKHIGERIPLAHQDQYEEEINFLKSITVFDKKNPPKREMIDLLALVKKYYYNPLTKGSNSLKDVLPAIMESSPVLKDKYSNPLSVGINLKDYVLYQIKEKKVIDPYTLLPELSDIAGEKLHDFIFKKDSLKEGAGAMKAFQVLQFLDISKEEKSVLRKALLNYCELDTLAMVMLYEHLNHLIKKN